MIFKKINQPKPIRHRGWVFLFLILTEKMKSMFSTAEKYKGSLKQEKLEILLFTNRDESLFLI